MSDEYAKTLVLDQLPASIKPSENGPSSKNSGAPDAPAATTDDSASTNYPAFEDTSWLT